ncbi:MAG: VWA domain-containing protein [Pyrinomonadaceae bacterium]
MRLATRLAAACALLATALAWSRAPAQSPRRAAETPRVVAEPDEALVVETDLVDLHVRVADARAPPVTDARREQFRVFEDGVEQEIKFFSREEVPINYGLVFGNTRSLRAHVGEMIGAAKTIVEGSRAGDEFFLARFEPRAGGVALKWDYTTERDALFPMLDSLRGESGAAALRDALYFSASYVARGDDGAAARGDGAAARGDETAAARSGGKPPATPIKTAPRALRRRALIVLTDGVDRASRYKEDELLARLAAEGVQVYAVGFLEMGGTGERAGARRREQARSLLARVADATGGRAFFPTSFAELPAVAREIARDLRTQYVVGYTPTNRARDGRFRSVRVTVSGGDGARTAATRPGYFAPGAKE